MQWIFFISHVGLPECQLVNRPKHVVHWLPGYEEFPDLPHMPAHSRQSGRQNIIARTHTWQQCSVSTSRAILTTKYGFNLRQNSPLNIENNTGYSGWIRVFRACANRSAITEVGTLLKRHTVVPSPTIPLHSVAWLEKGRGNSLKCNGANFSARRSQSGGIPGTWLLR